MLPSFGRPSSAIAAIAWLLACDGQSLDSEPYVPSGACFRDVDCGSGRICVPLDPAKQHPQPGLDPCSRYQRCGTNAGCGANQVCAPGWQTLGVDSGCHSDLCGPRCVEGSCPNDTRCNTTSGICEFVPCQPDQPGACPDHWRCDPEAALRETPNWVMGSAVVELANIERTIARGCVRRRCDESGGFVCTPTWDCQPESAEDGSGCVALPCQVSGCTDAASLICLSESAYPRPPGSTDPNGCVVRNCEEGGPECLLTTDRGNNIFACSPASPDADAYSGCVFLPCAEDADCFNGYVCEPGARGADERGCRRPSTLAPGVAGQCLDAR